MSLRLADHHHTYDSLLFLPSALHFKPTNDTRKKKARVTVLPHPHPHPSSRSSKYTQCDTQSDTVFYLMHNARSGRRNEQVFEGVGTPLQELKPLAVPLHFQRLVALHGIVTEKAKVQRVLKGDFLDEESGGRRDERDERGRGGRGVGSLRFIAYEPATST